MKSLLTIILTLLSINAYALDLSNEQIADLYNSGKITEKDFSKVQLTNTQRSQLLVNMEKVASSLARIWPDTVLEGPYTQLGKAQLDTDNIQAIFYKNQVIGFSAYVRAEAAFNDECSQDDETELMACLEDYKGFLYEKFIVNEKGEHIEEYVEPAEFDN